MEKKIKFTLSMLLLFAMALLSSVPVIAQTPVDIQRNKVLSTAYKYRKDINSIISTYRQAILLISAANILIFADTGKFLTVFRQ